MIRGSGSRPIDARARFYLESTKRLQFSENLATHTQKTLERPILSCVVQVLLATKSYRELRLIMVYVIFEGSCSLQCANFV